MLEQKDASIKISLSMRRLDHGLADDLLSDLHDTAINSSTTRKDQIVTGLCQHALINRNFVSSQRLLLLQFGDHSVECQYPLTGDAADFGPQLVVNVTDLLDLLVTGELCRWQRRRQRSRTSPLQGHRHHSVGPLEAGGRGALALLWCPFFRPLEKLARLSSAAIPPAAVEPLALVLALLALGSVRSYSAEALH